MENFQDRGSERNCFVSYAQNFEDVMLWRSLRHIQSGFYIDVGANDPEVNSVTKAFYDRGWHGINIEPIQYWYNKLAENRIRDVNLQIAAGDEPGEIPIYEIPESGYSTFNKITAERHERELGYVKVERIARVETLTSICQEFTASQIHFLNIDVEGMEKNVLSGLDLSNIRPWIILIESTYPNTQEESYAGWEDIVQSNGYDFVYFDGLNRFYLASEHRDLQIFFRCPPNVFDRFITRGQHFAEIRVFETTRRAEVAELDACKKSRLIEEAESRKNDAEKMIQQLLCQKKELEKHLADAKQDALLAVNRAEVAQCRARELEENSKSLEADAKRQENLALSAMSELRQAEKQIKSLENESSILLAAVSDLQTDNNALRKSWSWRMMAPARWIGGYFINTFNCILCFFTQVMLRGISLLNHPLTRLMRPVIENPLLAEQMNQWLLQYPNIHRQLRDIAIRNGLMSPPPVLAPISMMPASSSLPASKLPVRAFQIYHLLQDANKRKQERG